MNTPRAELAKALREVNVAWDGSPEPRPDVFAPLGDLERELNTAFAAGDELAAREIVAAWRAEALRLLGGDQR
jgi:hypothetical protein